ncbi:O-antigen ligase [Clostridium paraputrificum]|uniref:O-antigen polymerase n=1 Tax=Clostridium TaxID=1485 RepID=UPI00232DA366|nr:MULTISPECIES: O-antigen polymerase [Clostridium]MDB2103243.1 O-antigen ligase [Clostridium paraputrificum]MDU6521024.1 O-antigen polymerase [Clostridium sp.]
MILFLGMFFLGISYVFKKQNNSLLNPGSLFAILWGTVFCLYSFKLFEINSVSDKTIVVFSAGVISFCIGYYPIKFTLGPKRLYKSYELTYCGFKVPYPFRFLLLILSFITIAILAIRVVNTLPYWAGGVSFVKQANAEGYITYSSWVSILYTFLARPFETVAVFVAAMDFFFSRDRLARIQIFVTIIMIILGYLCSGSKFSLFVPVLSFVLVYYVYKSKKKTNRERVWEISGWKKGLIGVIGLIIIVFIIYMLNSKYGNWFRSLYFYLVGCLPCGDNAILDMQKSNVSYYGMVSLNGFARVIAQAFSFIGVQVPYSSYMNEAYNSILSYEHAIYIAPGVPYNAFISVFAYFYKDGGLFAVVLFSFIFGKLVSRMYERILREESAYSLILYLYSCYLVLFSIVRSQMYLVTSVMTLIYIILFFSRRKLVKR